MTVYAGMARGKCVHGAVVIVRRLLGSVTSPLYQMTVYTGMARSIFVHSAVGIVTRSPARCRTCGEK